MSSAVLDAGWVDALAVRFHEETELNMPNVIARIQAELDDLLNYFRTDDSEFDD